MRDKYKRVCPKCGRIYWSICRVSGHQCDYCKKETKRVREEPIEIMEEEEWQSL